MRVRSGGTRRTRSLTGAFAIDAKTLALRIATIARAKLAQRVIVLDMRQVSGFCDYFVIASVSSLRQANAVSEAIQEDLQSGGRKALSTVPAEDSSGWIALDYSSVIAHIFHKPLRELYALERLWSDAKRVRIPRKTH